MSKALDIADTIAARLNALPTLAGVPCLVDRQKDVANLVAGLVNKGKACCVSILYHGFANSNSSRSGRAMVARHYTASVYGRAVLAANAGALADDVEEIVSHALHFWDPERDASGFEEIDVSRSSLRPDKTYLIYDIDISVSSDL